MSLTTSISPLEYKSHGRIHLDHLDGLRAIAALCVIIFHVYAYHTANLSLRAQHLLSPIASGHWRVDIFIVLSGFCLMLPVARNDGILRGGAIEFFKRRAQRILPPYYAALALSLLLDVTVIGHKTGTPWDTSVPVTLRGLVTHLLLLQDLGRATWAQINSPMWSVAVEWRIYFCFPLLVWAWRRLGPWPMFIATVLASYLLVFVFLRVPALAEHVNSQSNGITPQYLGLFALGVFGAGIAFSPSGPLISLRERSPWMLIAGLTGFIAFYLYRQWTYTMYLNHLPMVDLAVGVFIATVLVAASTKTSILSRFLSWRPLVKIGTFAYSIYLIHFPILQIVWQYLLNPMHLGARTALCLHWLIALPASLGMAYLFFLAFERPYLVRRKNETPAEVARDAALSPAP